MRFRPFFLIFPVLLALSLPAAARETLDSILPQIRAAHPGRLSDAEPFIGSDGRAHYRIKWMTPEGRILYFDADAQTGRYSNSGGDNGGQWRGGENRGYEGEHRRGRDNWNGSDNSGGHGGGDWRDHEGGGDGNGPPPPDWGGRRGGWPGDWGGRGGDWGGHGGWRGGHGGGNNGGGGHHGGH